MKVASAPPSLGSLAVFGMYFPSGVCVAAAFPLLILGFKPIMDNFCGDQPEYMSGLVWYACIALANAFGVNCIATAFLPL